MGCLFFFFFKEPAFAFKIGFVLNWVFCAYKEHQPWPDHEVPCAHSINRVSKVGDAIMQRTKSQRKPRNGRDHYQVVHLASFFHPYPHRRLMQRSQIMEWKLWIWLNCIWLSLMLVKYTVSRRQGEREDLLMNGQKSGSWFLTIHTGGQVGPLTYFPCTT